MLKVAGDRAFGPETMLTGAETELIERWIGALRSRTRASLADLRFGTARHGQAVRQGQPRSRGGSIALPHCYREVVLRRDASRDHFHWEISGGGRCGDVDVELV